MVNYPCDFPQVNGEVFPVVSFVSLERNYFPKWHHLLYCNSLSVY